MAFSFFDDFCFLEVQLAFLLHIFEASNSVLMSIFSRFGNNKVLRSPLIPIYSKQAACVRQASERLVEMMKTMDVAEWRRLQKEIKKCEIQGDALLTVFHDEIYRTVMSFSLKDELQTLAMSIDDYLDSIDGAGKCLLLYLPTKIAPQIREMVQYIYEASLALEKMLSLAQDVKNNSREILYQCERITQIEHETDELYEEFIAYLFKNEKDPIELIRYKNIAEILENTADLAKAASDCERTILLRYSHNE